MGDTPLLLDTHVWIWYLENASGRLSTDCFALLDAASSENRLRVSVMSVWEVALLDSRGRLRLGTDCGVWVERALEAPGTSLAGIDSAIAVASHRLPGAFHRDPVDQLLVATARHFGWTLVTRDRGTLEYARSGHVMAVDAGARRIPR